MMEIASPLFREETTHLKVEFVGLYDSEDD